MPLRAPDPVILLATFVNSAVLMGLVTGKPVIVLLMVCIDETAVDPCITAALTNALPAFTAPATVEEIAPDKADTAGPTAAVSPAAVAANDPPSAPPAAPRAVLIDPNGAMLPTLPSAPARLPCACCREAWALARPSAACEAAERLSPGLNPTRLPVSACFLKIANACSRVSPSGPLSVNVDDVPWGLA